MKHVRWIVFVAALGGAAAATGSWAQTSQPSTMRTGPRDYPVKPVPFTAVRFGDGFWAPRIETNRAVSIPFAFQKCEESKRIYHFEPTAAVLRGEPLQDTGPARLSLRRQRPLRGNRRSRVRAQHGSRPQARGLHRRPDREDRGRAGAGQLSLYHTHDRSGNPHRWAGKKRWELEKVDSHELYNVGHLYEAAVAHHQATGKRTLLEVAIRTADLLLLDRWRAAYVASPPSTAPRGAEGRTSRE